MILDSVKDYLLAKPGATEGRPFGPEALVFKVMGKMFALVSWQEDPLRINLKCDPDLALTLRAQYPAVLPGYHMNKKHWNTLVLDGTIPQDEVWSMMDHSYQLVVQSLKKAERQQLAALESPAEE
ncbi:MAG: MmcQ/YjbR family DNA-binding protein [Chloroflexi bacterium]|nr:MAG: MmcQ/YjbR family DNA-binding protein [Chloroflexota bacterium]